MTQKSLPCASLGLASPSFVLLRIWGGWKCVRYPSARGNGGFPSCVNAWCLDRLARVSDADRFSRCSQTAMSKPPTHPFCSRTKDIPHEDAVNHVSKLVQPCLVFRRVGFVTDFVSERNQKPIESYTKCVLKSCFCHPLSGPARCADTLP